MTAMLDDAVADLRHANAVLQQRLDEYRTERDEALAREAATAEVLQVINSSPGELGPVFEAMLDKATLLSEAAFGVLWTYDGELFHAMAFRNVPPAFAEFLREPQKASPITALGRIALGEPLAHIPDIAADEYYRLGGLLAQSGFALAGFRTMLAVPMRKHDVLLGAVTIYRKEVRLFSDKQIALLQNFAAQAVIAMENARLLTETREALEQRTATTEVLQVINSSPGDLGPVFDEILEKAHALCGAEYGGLATYDGEYFRLVAARGYPDHMVEVLRRPFRGNFSHQQLLHGERYVHIEDALALPKMADSAGQVTQEGGFRTVLMVPLRKDGALLGHISASRQEVSPFSKEQIALLENFAAQAVIAMENARLLTETREALAQQTATAEVLQVINRSPGDLAPVFDAILEKAHRLCGAAFGSLGIFAGETWRAVVQRGYGEPLASKLREGGRGSDNPLLQELIDGAPLVHVADLAQLDHPIGHANVAAGILTLLLVALRKDDALLGTISIARREPRPFSDKEVALLEKTTQRSDDSRTRLENLAHVRIDHKVEITLTIARLDVL